MTIKMLGLAEDSLYIVRRHCPIQMETTTICFR